MPSGLSKLGAIYMPLSGLIDVKAEAERLQGQRAKVLADIERVDAKLANKAFVDKAPAEVVALQRTRRKELQETADKLQRLVEMLGN